MSNQKVLYIGVLDRTGWGTAAQNYILALDGVGVDVVCRPAILGTPISYLSPRIKELVEKDFGGQPPDIVIQHILPNMMEYDGRVYNIGLFATETDNYNASYWGESLNCMDQLWIPNQSMLFSMAHSGVRDSLISSSSLIPHASDVKRFEKQYAPNSYIQRLKDEGKFVFYTVGEFNRRKNWVALLRAFHAEFSPEEPVELVLKVNGNGVTQDIIRERCKDIHVRMKMYSHIETYKQEHIFTGNISEDELCSIHTTSDCFVQPSYGEAWSYPAFDAMAFGKTPIVTGATGYLDYLSNREGWLCNYHEEPCFGYAETFPEQCSSRDTWAAVDILHLQQCMRQAYEEKSLRKVKSVAGIARAYDFSYEVVGNRMKEALLTCQETKSSGKI